MYLKFNITGIASIGKPPRDDAAISIAGWKKMNDVIYAQSINTFITNQRSSLPRVLRREARQLIDIIFQAEKKH